MVILFLDPITDDTITVTKSNSGQGLSFKFLIGFFEARSRESGLALPCVTKCSAASNQEVPYMLKVHIFPNLFCLIKLYE